MSHGPPRVFTPNNILIRSAVFTRVAVDMDIHGCIHGCIHGHIHGYIHVCIADLGCTMDISMDVSTSFKDMISRHLVVP